MEDSCATIDEGSFLDVVDDDDGVRAASLSSQRPSEQPATTTNQRSSSRRLEALYHWLFVSFPRFFAAPRTDDHHCGNDNSSSGSSSLPESSAAGSSVGWLNDIEISNAIVRIASEICAGSETTPTNGNNSNNNNNSSDDEVVVARRTTAKEAWDDIQSILNNADLLLLPPSTRRANNGGSSGGGNATGEEEGNDDDDDDEIEITTSSWNDDKCTNLLCILLCHALSPDCIHQRTYVAAIMSMTNRTDVQQEIMRIVQERQQRQQQENGRGGGGGGGGRMRHNEEEEDEECYENNTGDYSLSSNLEATTTTMTGDYSTLHEGGTAAGGATAKNDGQEEEVGLALRHDVNETNIAGRAPSTSTPTTSAFQTKGTKRIHVDITLTDDISHNNDGNYSDTDDRKKESSLTVVHNDDNESTQLLLLRNTIAKLQQRLTESNKKEMTYLRQVDTLHSSHRAEMLQVESKYLSTIRDIEARYTTELISIKTENETLRDYETKVKSTIEENSRLHDELDILQTSKEKLCHAEEQLRKCREKLDIVGDTASALQREEMAHAASVDRCLLLESELAALRPVKRQLEEYRVRTADAEVALSDCREELRRVKARSMGLEGTVDTYERDAKARHGETSSLQKRLLEEGSNEKGIIGGAGCGGIIIGSGMSELNPELMSELKTLRSEYVRLKDFEAKREVDAVQRLEESYDDSQRLVERYKGQYFTTKSTLEDTQSLLHESMTREANLQSKVDELLTQINVLDVEMKEERLKAHKTALEVERNYQNEKKELITKSRQELKDMEDRLLTKLDNERKQHKEKLDRAESQRVEMENNLSAQLVELREQSATTLRSTKEMGQKLLKDMEQSKQAEITKILQDKTTEIEALMTKGKGMIRESRQKAKTLQAQITNEYEVKIKNLEHSLESIRNIQVEYETTATTKIEKRDQQLLLLDAKVREASATNSQLQDKVQKVERSNKDLVTDNDRLRRQLGSRFGPTGGGGTLQNQLDELLSVCQSLQDENRQLKDMNPDRLLFASIGNGGSNNSESMTSQHQHMSAGEACGGATFSKTALTEFRTEYEEKIESLTSDKRELIMKCTASANETRKAEARSWDLEDELSKVRAELVSVQLALQRLERKSEFTTSLDVSGSKSSTGSTTRRGDDDDDVKKEKENSLNSSSGTEVIKTKNQEYTPKSPPRRGIYGGNSINSKTTQKTVAALPSLMDHLAPTTMTESNSSTDPSAANNNQECTQS